MSFQDTSKVLQITDELLEHARLLASNGCHQQAEEICQQILNNIVELYGPKSLKMCTCLAILADVNYAQRKYDHVVVLLQQVLYINSSESFFSNEEVLSYSFKFARSLERCGNTQDACKTYMQLLRDSKGSLGASSSFSRRVEESLRSLIKRNFHSIQDAQRLLDELDGFTTSSKFVSSSKLRTAFEEKPVTGAARVLQFTNRRAPRIASAVACIGLCLWFFLAGTIKDHSGQPNGAEATAALHSTTPGLLSMYIGNYSSADGFVKVTISPDNKAVLFSNNEQKEMKVRQLGAELYLESKGQKQVVRTSGQGLVDENGTKLYRAGSPETKTIESMDAIAFVLNEFYSQHGRYPRSPREFQSMGDKIRYINSSNNTELFPRYQQIAPQGAAYDAIGMSLSDYTAINQAASRLSAQSGNKEQPGLIETYSLPVGVTGDTMVIRGFDRDGLLLPSSLPGKCFNLTLSGGTVRKI